MLSQEEPDEDLAVARRPARALPLLRRRDATSRCERIETALELAEALVAPRDPLAGAEHEGDHPRRARTRSSRRLRSCRYALEVALEHDKPSAALRAYYNLADTLCQADRYEEAVDAVRDGLALARRVGNR